jgi:hypothetical protein
MDLFQFIMQFCVVQSELSWVASYLLVIVMEEFFLIIKVREVIITVGSHRLGEHFVGASRIRRH